MIVALPLNCPILQLSCCSAPIISPRRFRRHLYDSASHLIGFRCILLIKLSCRMQRSAHATVLLASVGFIRSRVVRSSLGVPTWTTTPFLRLGYIRKLCGRHAHSRKVTSSNFSYHCYPYWR